MKCFEILMLDGHQTSKRFLKWFTFKKAEIKHVKRALAIYIKLLLLQIFSIWCHRHFACLPHLSAARDPDSFATIFVSCIYVLIVLRFVESNFVKHCKEAKLPRSLFACLFAVQVYT